MSKRSRWLSSLLVAAVLATACDEEGGNPAAPAIASAPKPAALAVTVTWALAPTPATTVVAKGDTGQIFAFTATVTGGVAPYTYAWQFADGTPLGTGNPVTHQFYYPGSYKVFAIVTDAAGTTARSDSVEVLEMQVSPTAFTLACRSDVDTGEAPLNVQFAAVPDGNVGPLGWRWDFGDGASSTERITSHVYAGAGWDGGTFAATATAKDSLDRTASCSKEIRVSRVCEGRIAVLHLSAVCTHGINVAYDFDVPPGDTVAGSLQRILDLWAFFGDPLTVDRVDFVRCR